MIGLKRLTWKDLRAFSGVTGVKMSPWVAEMVLRFDGVIVAAYHKRQQSDSEAAKAQPKKPVKRTTRWQT